MLLTRRSKIAAAVAICAVALVAAAAVFVDDGLSSSELIVERSSTAELNALVLDVEETTANAPVLAQLLDEAASTGRATTSDEDDGIAAEAYLQQLRARDGQAEGGQPVVSWKGQQFLVYRSVS